jgi:hypothetical protein
MHLDTETLKKIDTVIMGFIGSVIMALFKQIVKVLLTSLLSDKFISELIVHALQYLEPKATNNLQTQLIQELEQQLKHPDGSHNAPTLPK